MYHYTIFLLVFLLICTICNVLTTVLDDKTSWDYLIFTQHWPVTVCAEWQEKNPSNKCNFPPAPDVNFWTVHGIWPTKIGTEGPGFCNKTWHFDPEQLKPFEGDLEKYWTNIEANTKLTSLWKHEWVKHGTCASQLPELSGESNYFHKGITWVQQYNLAEMLMNNKVVPNNIGYTMQEIHNSVRNVTKKNPVIQCVVDKNSKQSLLSEIRLCFDKTLQIVDCDLLGRDLKYRRNPDGILTNCNVKKPIMYFAQVPVNEENYQIEQEMADEAWFVNKIKLVNKLRSIYDGLQFLIWLTR